MTESNPRPESRGRILRLPTVMERTGLSRTSVYELVKLGRFPDRIRLSTRAVGWIEPEVDAWILQRIDARKPQRTPLQKLASAVSTAAD